MAAIQAPDGRPARPVWQASLIGVGYLTGWVAVGFIFAALALRAFA